MTKSSLDWQPFSSRTEIELKLDKISKLKKGWRYGEGEAPKSENIERASLFDDLLKEEGFHKKDIFPGVQGDLTLQLYLDEQTLEITFENDGTISFGLIKNNEYVREESEPHVIDAAKTLMEIVEQECKLSDSYTSMNMIDLKDDSYQGPFRIYVEPSPLFSAVP